MMRCMLLVLALLFALPLAGHRASLKSGSLSSLKGQMQLNVLFDYAGMTIGARKLSEDAYVQKREEAYNEKQANLGTKWAAEWRGDKMRLYEPAFIEELNEAVNGSQAGNYASAKYTLVLHTLHIEPGYDAGISGARAWVSLEAKLMETSNPDNQIALITVFRSVSENSQRFGEGRRIMAAYQSAGKAIGLLIVKKVS